jgi:hypothetical protein
VISHGPKFREPQHINWKHNFKIIMDAVEDYARRIQTRYCWKPCPQER